MAGDKIVASQRFRKALNCCTHGRKQVWLYRLPHVYMLVRKYKNLFYLQVELKNLIIFA